MSYSQRRKAEKSDKEDVISGLPRNIIDSILDGMPVRDAARTSILSTKWRYTWKSHTNLVLDKQFYDDKFKTSNMLAATRRSYKFVCLINEILQLRRGPILKFSLYIPILHYPNQRRCIDNCIVLLSWNGIKQLTLENEDDVPYELPPHLFSCLKLTHLRLCYCVFKSPRPTVVFGHLISLYLNRIIFSDNRPFGKVVVSAPLLQFLALETCNGIGNVNMQTPKLEVLHVLDSLEVESICLKRIPNLTVIRIELCKELESRLGLGSIDMTNIFGDLPKIQKLTFDAFFVKFLAAGMVLRRFPIMFNQLKHIQLHNLGFNDVDQISCLLCFIRSSPNLQILEILRGVAVTVKTDDLGLVFDYLTAPDCMDKTLDQLRTVRIGLSKNLSGELLFIKLLLARSPSLEKMIIEVTGKLDANDKFKITRELMCFSRASSRAEMMWVD
ncbi:F-box/FBD/LRR-repeat protein At1g13570-like [Cornus florida]|uniref:F-box/FBD/LRR-repeat protein At1g13570-like n=1 Tax=Cornus florida TaxID=4283 RepID=UPI00289F6CFA|nr:F-box/FBD/LRR-repeat protein At1g13570-like [Cornus florida]